MKKIFLAMVLILMLGFAFTACSYLPNIPGVQLPKEDVITIEDGYIVVNGVKTDYKIDKDDVIEVVDGYLVVNGTKTDYEVKTSDVIEVEDGYLVVNGVKTNHKVHTEPVISVIDGYVAVNGVKSDYKVHTEPVISVIDGYVAVNGVKTQYKVDTGDAIDVVGGYLVVNGVTTDYKVYTEPVISVIDGYVAVNGVKTDYKVHTDPVISVIDGYIAVNGVKTDYMVSTGCNHIWETVTTPATCIAGGYDTMTCKLCDKSVVTNTTAQLAHTYGTTYITDNTHHWYQCAGCDAVKDMAAHDVDEDGVCVICYLAVSETPGIIYDISADGTYADVIGYEGNAKNIKIASEYNGVPVRSIYEYAFLCMDITSVIIPEGVTEIGKSAFAGCNNMTYISIPSTIEKIDNYAFMGMGTVNVHITDLEKWCTQIEFSYVCFDSGFNLYVNEELITDLIIPSGISFISDEAFEHCYSITSVTIPGNVTNIGKSAFAFCRNLESVNLSYGVATIEASAFYSCNKLESITLPNSLKAIENNAFYGCSALESVVLPESLIIFGSNAFQSCPNIEYTEYENCKYLGSENNPYFVLMEATNKNYSKYTIHNDTKIIAGYAFNYCPRFEYAVIPDGVISIGNGSFASSEKLVSVVIPDTVIYIGNSAFGDNLSFKYIYYKGSQAEWNAIDKDAYFPGSIYYNYVPA